MLTPNQLSDKLLPRNRPPTFGENVSAKVLGYGGYPLYSWMYWYFNRDPSGPLMDPRSWEETYPSFLVQLEPREKPPAVTTSGLISPDMPKPKGKGKKNQNTSMNKLRKQISKVESKQKRQQRRPPKQKPRGGYQPKRGAVALTPTTQRVREIAAPIINSQVRNAGMQMSFGAGSRVGCMTIRGSLLVGTLNNLVDSKSNVFVGMSTSTGLYLQAGWLVCPQNHYYFGSPVTYFTLLFERYRIRTRLEYRPRCPATQPGSFKIVYLEDPVAFYAMTGKGTAGYSPNVAGIDAFYPQAVTLANISGYPTVYEGPAWASFETDWSHVFRDQDMNYTTAKTYNGYIDAANTLAIDLRQSMAGYWIFSGSGFTDVAGNSTSTPMGEIWVHYDLELCDLVTSSVSTAIGDPMVFGRRPVDTLDTMVKQLREKLSIDDSSESKRSGSRSRDTRFGSVSGSQ